MNRRLGLILLALITATHFTPQSQAEVVLKTIDYQDSSSGHPTTLEGTVAYDTSAKGKRPGVLVIHEWTGIDDYTQMRLKKLAELGYVAFAADIYGKGVRPKTPQDAGATATIYKKDRPLMRERARLGLAELKKQSHVDSAHVAVIGYCFGGTTTLELARSGAKAQGFVSFHGGLDTPNPADAKNIKAPVEVYTGAADPSVPPAQVASFEKEMKDAGVKYEVVSYPGAVHGFTNPDHGNDPSKGVAYNAEADAQSWAAMKAFFKKVL